MTVALLLACMVILDWITVTTAAKSYMVIWLIGYIFVVMDRLLHERP